MADKTAQIGDRVRHIITGFTGIVIGHSKWITGCDTLGIRPEELHDGKPIDPEWFDIGHVKVIKKGAVKPTNTGEVKEPSGGPQTTPNQGR